MSRAIAILGGTGPEGFGLALRWARAGEIVIIGSRDAKRQHLRDGQDEGEREQREARRQQGSVFRAVAHHAPCPAVAATWR